MSGNYLVSVASSDAVSSMSSADDMHASNQANDDDYWESSDRIENEIFEIFVPWSADAL